MNSTVASTRLLNKLARAAKDAGGEVVGLLGGGRWEVSGEILNAAGEPRMSLRGKWNEKVEVTRPAGGGTEARPISHWSPYDRVGVVNADP